MRELLLKYAVLFLPASVTAVILLLKSFWKRLNEDVFAVISVMGLAAVAYFAWKSFLGQAGFGDQLSLVSTIIFALASVLTVIFSVSYLDRSKMESAEFLALILLAVFGSIALTGSGNLIVVFIGLEILSFSAYVMAGYNKLDAYSSEASIKYFVLGAFSSAVFLFGIALYYGSVGSFQLVSTVPEDPVLLHVAAALMLAGLAFKAAAVPFQWWAPDVYQGAPLPATAFFATTIKGAALVVMFRVVSILPVDMVHILSAVAIATMFFGNLAALFQEDIKRMLAYSSIAHAGYMLLALVYAKKDPSSAGAQLLFYIVAYIVMTMGAFASLRHERTQISEFSGYARRRPAMALAFAIFMFSLAGVPPLGGFFAKFYLFSGLVENGHVLLAVVAVINSLISVYYYMRPVVVMYFSEGSTARGGESCLCGYSLPGVISFCAIATILIGLFPSVILAIVSR